MRRNIVVIKISVIVPVYNVEEIHRRVYRIYSKSNIKRDRNNNSK